MQYPLEISNSYNEFLKTQDAILTHINYKKNSYTEMFDEILKQPKQDIRRSYNKLINTKENIKTQTNSLIKKLDDLTIKTIENSQKLKNELNKIIEIFDDFSIKIGEAQVSTLEELVRDSLNKSNIDTENLPETYKRVLKNKFGGKRRKTIKKRTK